MTNTPHRLHWQDFRGHIAGIGMKYPARQSKDFPTKASAEAEKRHLIAAGGVT